MEVDHSELGDANADGTRIARAVSFNTGHYVVYYSHYP